MKKLKLLDLILLLLLAGILIWIFYQKDVHISRTMITSPQPKQHSPLKADISVPKLSHITTATIKSVAEIVPPKVSTNVEKSVINAVPEEQLAKSDMSTNAVNAIIRQRVEEERVPVIRIYLDSVMMSLKLYRDDIGCYPTGNNQKVASALLGNNSKGIAYLDGYGWTNNQGELVDPWKMPYSFNFESNAITVRSSGPNKIFGDTDDVVRVQNY